MLAIHWLATMRWSKIKLSKKNLGLKSFGSKIFLIQTILVKKFCQHKYLSPNNVLFKFFFGPMKLSTKEGGKVVLFIVTVSLSLKFEALLENDESLLRVEIK